MATEEYTISRLRTRVAGLDDLLAGGLPENSQNLVAGTLSSGKTLLAFEILYRNAMAGIPCSFITIDQTVKDVLREVTGAMPSLDCEKAMKAKLLNIAEIQMDSEFSSRESFLMFLSNVINAARSNSSKLIAIDSISLMRALFENNRSFTRSLNFMVESLKYAELTTVIVTETASKVQAKVPGLFEESMFDNVLRLKNYRENNIVKHKIAAVKMRYAPMKAGYASMEITPDGIVIGGIVNDEDG